MTGLMSWRPRREPGKMSSGSGIVSVPATACLLVKRTSLYSHFVWRRRRFPPSPAAAAFSFAFCMNIRRVCIFLVISGGIPIPLRLRRRAERNPRAMVLQCLKLQPQMAMIWHQCGFAVAVTLRCLVAAFCLHVPHPWRRLFP